MAVDAVLYGYVANEEAYEDKAVILEEGSKGDWIYVVLEGQVKVTKQTPKGTITIRTLKQGEVFGEMGLFEFREGVRSASIVADGHVKLGILDSNRLHKDYESISPLMKGLIRSLIVQLGELTSKLVSRPAE